MHGTHLPMYTTPQSLISTLVAAVTLTIYTGWMHILLALLMFSLSGRVWAIATFLGLYATLLLPPKPVSPVHASSYVFLYW